MGMFDAPEWIRDMNETAKRHAKDREVELGRILAEPCMDSANVGDSVLVSAGLLLRGLAHERLECKVLRVGDTSYKVEVQKDLLDGPDIRWIPRAIVIEVIPA